MEFFLLYCDLSTLKCTSDEINVTLNSFTESYSQVNDSLWFFKYDAKTFNPLPKEEYIFYEYFEQFITENSIIFIEKLRNDYYYQLPDTNHDFLQQD